MKSFPLMISMDKKSLYYFYKQHIEEVLLPFWLRALDHKYGGVYTCFNNKGDRLISKDKYTWSQGRFLWLWSKVFEMVSENKLSGEAGDYYGHLHKTVSFIEENVFMENGNCAFLLAESGKKKESISGKGFDTSFYADCFIVIGMSKYAGVVKDIQRFENALKLYNRIRERLEAGDIRSEPYSIPKGYRAHSVPMIMLNVTQELTEAAQILNHQKRKKLHHYSLVYMDDIMNNFYQSDHRVYEMIPITQPQDNRLFNRHLNPGHTIECMWFVMDLARKTNHEDYILKASKAVEKAIELGWDAKYGGLLRFVDEKGGKPKGEQGLTSYEKLISNTWDMKLWWPHSETLYATLLAFDLIKDDRFIRMHEKMHNYIFNTFPNPDKNVGEWIQIRDRKGKPIDKIAALPVKDPFHILRNMLMIIDLLDDESRS